MADITVLSTPVIQGEGKWFKFTYTANGVAVAMPAKGAGVYSFIIKAEIGATETLFTATTFDDTNRATGIIRANLPASASVLLPVGNVFAEMKAVITADTDVDKKIVKFKVEPKV